MKQLIIVLVTVIFIAGCGDRDTYTLYRDSALNPDLRIHVATFDAKGGDGYNRDNCNQAERLFQNQMGVKTKFWCEKGVFKD